MKGKFPKSVFLIPLFLLCFIKIGVSADREIGGYVDKAEDRFVRNVWNFIKNFQGWQNIGGNRYQAVQYYWSEPRFFNTESMNFVDKMDLVYVASHGSAYYTQSTQTPNTGAMLNSCPGYGYLPTNGDIEFLIIESCSTVASAPEAGGGDWWSPWANSIFKGLHQLVGFRTLSYSDNGIPNNFANKLKGNGGVWQSWFNAVNEERSIWHESSWPGYASAILYTTTENDRLGNYAADPAPGANNMETWWQY
ncbi:MAG: DUF6345 domain-containing protein [Bacteroidota bacterium]